jgi:hypothetical protein
MEVGLVEVGLVEVGLVEVGLRGFMILIMFCHSPFQSFFIFLQFTHRVINI